jgi:hypothetical protein
MFSLSPIGKPNYIVSLCAEHHQKISYTETRNRVETGLLSHGLRNSYSFLIPLQRSIISIVHLMASSSLCGACSKASVVDNYEDNSWAFVVITCLFA